MIAISHCSILTGFASRARVRVLRSPAFRVATSVVGLLLAVGCGPPRASFDEAVQAGLTEYELQRYPEAIAMFKRAADYDRERPEPSYYIGRCYLATAQERFRENSLLAAVRNCDRAIAAYDDSINAFPGFGRAVQGKADALKLKGKQAAALEIASWAARYSGPQARKLILKANLYAQAGDMDNAQLAMKQATSVEPSNAATHAELGLFYMRCGNDTKAAACLRKARDLNPSAPGVAMAIEHLETGAPRP